MIGNNHQFHRNARIRLKTTKKDVKKSDKIVPKKPVEPVIEVVAKPTPQPDDQAVLAVGSAVVPKKRVAKSAENQPAKRAQKSIVGEKPTAELIELRQEMQRKKGKTNYYSGTRVSISQYISRSISQYTVPTT